MASRYTMAVLIALGSLAGLEAQAPGRRLATIDALRQFASFYHLQRVLVSGEVVLDGTRAMLRAGDAELRVAPGDGIRIPDGPVELRGTLVDVGRLEPGDPRAGLNRATTDWPRPGEELVLQVESATEAPQARAPTVRAIALAPWRFEGEVVSVVGAFRGRNLFGDLADSPGVGRYDFVLRGTEGAVWVTGLRPRGNGFNLDVDRRVDTGRWLEVSGTVVRERGLVRIEATRLALADAPEFDEAPDEPEPPRPPAVPAEVIFSVPTDRDIDVSPGAPVRLQFSRGLDAASLDGHIRVSYVGQTPAGTAPALAFTASYDPASRSVQLDMAEPFETYRTVRVELLEGLLAFDGAPVTLWSMTFSVGG